MRIHRGVRTLAAVASLAAATAPAAYASDIGEGAGGIPPSSTPAHVASGHRDSGSTDWAEIGLGAGGAVVLAGAAVGGSRALGRRRTTGSEVGPAGVS